MQRSCRLRELALGVRVQRLESGELRGGGDQGSARHAALGARSGHGVRGAAVCGAECGLRLPLASRSDERDGRAGRGASDVLFGARIGNLFSAAMAGALLSSISAMSLVVPRVYYAMGRDRCFPAGAAEVYPCWGTPVRAICYQAIVSALMALTETFEALIYYIGFSLILFAALAVAVLLRLRKRPGFRRLRAVSWGYPAIPLLFVGVSLWMLVWTFLLRPRESALRLLTIACGTTFYGWRLRGSVQQLVREKQEAVP